MSDVDELVTAAEAAAMDDELDLNNEQEVKQRLAGDHPVIPPVPDLVCTLPRGYNHNGTPQTEVEVRELNGADEERLARYKTEEDVYNAIITMCTVRVGSIDLSDEPYSARDRILDSLLTGERELIFLTIVAATFGNEKEYGFICGYCEEQNEITILLDEDLPLELPDEELRFHHEFTTKRGNTIVFRLPVGSDLDGLAGITNIAARTTHLLSQVIVSINGEPPLDAKAAAQNLNSGDRSQLEQEIKKHSPYIKMTLETECSSCGEEQNIPLQWGQFLSA